MVHSLMKFRLLFVLALILQIVMLPLQSLAAENDTKAPSWIEPITYLALGDSLAFGINSDGQPGAGFPDFIAQALGSTETLQASNKGFSFPGYTTVNVLEDLRTNVTKPIVGIGHENQNAQLQNAIKDADLLTISVGANDVLPHFKIDSNTGKASFNLAEISTAIGKVGANYNQILKAIYDINPNVQVFIMGYYNPFPHAAPELQPGIAQLVEGLNGAIQAGMKGTTAIFVPTKDQIAADFKSYLPNPKNIHLNEAGYKVVAEAFTNQFKTDYTWITKDTLTATAVDKTTVNLNWKPAKDNKAVVGYTIYKGTEKIDRVSGEVLTYNVGNLEKDKTYTFSVAAVDEAGNESMVNPTTQISTVTVPEIPEPIAFTDIANHWAKEFIEQAVATGIVTGYSDGTFKPEKQLTRAQATSILVKALNLKSDEATPFTDIQNYAKETQADIAAAYKYGLVKGNNHTFHPNKPVTRAQLALMVKRSYELVKGEPYRTTKTAPFADIAKYDAETKAAITMLHEFGIVSGADGNFMPSNPTTRAQAAKIFVNYASLMK